MERRPDYDAATYQEATYAEVHKQGYLQFRNETLDELIEERQHDSDELRILEIACGPGLSLAHLARTHPRHQLVAIDRSAAMLAQSRDNINAAAGTPRLARASALRLPFEAQVFDLVFATRFIHIYRDQSKVLDELRRVLKPDGVLAIEFYGRPYHLLPFLSRRMNCPWRQFTWQYPTLANVRALMGDGMRIVPLRLGGERWLRRFLGERRLAFCLRHARHTPIQLLVAEYFAVSRA
jgi:SAM-dependent methyltransferase